MLLSVIIPTLNAARSLPATLDALGQPAFGHEVIVVDARSTDGTLDLAERRGLHQVTGPRSRGVQMGAGAAIAKGPWLLFLHADTRLAAGWETDAAAFMADPENAGRAAYFTFALDDDRPAARRLERLVAWRNRAWALPYGDQGLLIAADTLDALGGVPNLPIMEDVALVRRLVRRLGDDVGSDVGRRRGGGNDEVVGFVENIGAAGDLQVDPVGAGLRAVDVASDGQVVEDAVCGGRMQAGLLADLLQ